MSKNLDTIIAGEAAGGSRNDTAPVWSFSANTTKKIDERLPKFIGEGMYPAYPSVQSPWGKLYNFHDLIHYIERYNEVVSAAIMQGYRILIPDYVERTMLLCQAAYDNNLALYEACGEEINSFLHVHPFCRGAFVGGLRGDQGDETLLMCGRVNDFGTYRVEKELDVCYWDIVGSELCRSTTMSLQAMGNSLSKHQRPGPSIDYCMVEAKGCGDRHCRVVAESREKYPMPPHELWQAFGPIATADQIKYTPDDECVSESQVLRQECNYTFANGTNLEVDYTSLSVPTMACSATSYLFPGINRGIAEGKLDEKFVMHVMKCVCEAAGKGTFGHVYCRDGLRDWLGVPREIGYDDGRVMGAHIETYLQAMTIPYEIEAFNQEEVIYVIDRNKLSLMEPKYVDCIVAYWYGATKTLINAQWALWEEPENTPEDKIRIKIAKKVDKFC